MRCECARVRVRACSFKVLVIIIIIIIMMMMMMARIRGGASAGSPRTDGRPSRRRVVHASRPLGVPRRGRGLGAAAVAAN